MSYENKDTIQDSIIHYYDHVLFYNEYTDDVLKEIDRVYEQATKADEYEAKAKAWDKYKAHMESHIAGEVNEEEFVSDLKSDYFESGEYDA